MPHAPFYIPDTVGREVGRLLVRDSLKGWKCSQHHRRNQAAAKQKELPSCGKRRASKGGDVGGRYRRRLSQRASERRTIRIGYEDRREVGIAGDLENLIPDMGSGNPGSLAASSDQKVDGYWWNRTRVMTAVIDLLCHNAT